ncbi:MAG: tRNA uridine(34) 5-carboxymethylaminomethyl modification radical SAM/GNAT enzyme Elp3 [Nanoarchaeota archaeon]
MQIPEFFKEMEENLEEIKSRDQLMEVRKKLAQKYKLRQTPSLIQILCHLSPESVKKYKDLIITKPTRTISGVAPVAIMAKPFNCPTQAQCTFCPGGPGSIYGDTPKSYPGGSPAHRRAERNKYDAYLQVFNRLEHYFLLNQDCSKIELIIMGGTFPTYPKIYRHGFIADAVQAMNDFSDLFYTPEFNLKKFRIFFELPGEVQDEARTKQIQKKLLEMKKTTTLEREQKINETSNIRCVALCIETRADCAHKVHIDDMLKLGATRVEVGVQSLYDDVLKKVERGNTNADNIKATQMLKDAFLKVGYHMMLGLPGSSAEQDIQMHKELFANPDYKPDALKVYPCMVFKGTKLYEQYKKGEFTPINAQEALQRIIQIKQYFPTYCRVMRIQRDIPTYMVEAGVEKTNLRQEIEQELKKRDMRCRCIRCREPKKKEIDWSAVQLKRLNYEASRGQELFLSYEDVKNDLLLGFCRIRIPFKPYRPEITANTAGIRELHVYGTAVQIGAQTEKEVQHKGLGTQLMEEAERIAAEEFDAKKMIVIAGIGAREYFKKKLGYQQDGVYVSKKIKE